MRRVTNTRLLIALFMTGATVSSAQAQTTTTTGGVDAATPAPGAGPAITFQPPPPAATPDPDAFARKLAKGRLLFEERCIDCHGRAGRGDGPASPFIRPAPRDLTAGVFKFRSTPSGALPTDADIGRSLAHGLFGSAMPAWQGKDASREAVVAYLKSLAPRFADAAAAPPAPVLVMPPPPPEDAAAAARGRQHYRRLGCDKCHGEQARGNGPSTPTLQDTDGTPIVPANLHRPESYRGGCRPEELYRILATGMDGTPMPSYAESMTSVEAWDLVAYMRSLVRDRAACEGP